MPYIRRGLSLEDLYEAGAVYGDGKDGGDKQIEMNGHQYIVRLMRGMDLTINPRMPADEQGYEIRTYSGKMSHNSEWNRLMLPILKRTARGTKTIHDETKIHHIFTSVYLLRY